MSRYTDFLNVLNRCTDQSEVDEAVNASGLPVNADLSYADIADIVGGEEAKMLLAAEVRWFELEG